MINNIRKEFLLLDSLSYCKEEYIINKYIVPIWEKVTITPEEASAYSSIGINTIYQMLDDPDCEFKLYVGTKKRLIKRKAFEKYLEDTYAIDRN